LKGGVSDYGEALLTEQVEANLVTWLQWSLLGIGAFENVGLGQQSAWDADRSRLRVAQDPRYPANTLWQAHRSDWCWESGIPYSTQPVQVSGVWVNDAFVPTTGTGPYQHRVNYPLGQVVFASAVPATAVVQAEFSSRFVQVRRSDEPWFRRVTFDSLRADDVQFAEPSTSGGGSWAVLAENRVQLPAVVVEPVLNGTARPLEIGSSAQEYTQDFLLHVMAETPWDRKRVHDLCRLQVDKRIVTFDLNEAPPPLDGYGRLNAGALTYPQLCEAYPWRQLRVARVDSADQPQLGRNLWWSTLRFHLQLDHP
jgi:hypothetical protein